MAISNEVSIPDDMSCVNFMDAVWSNIPFASIVIETGAAPLYSNIMSTAEKIYKMMLNEFNFDLSNNSFYVNDFCGKLLKFHIHPGARKVDSKSYDHYYGEGSLQRTLEDYQKRDPSKKMDSKEEYTFEKLVKHFNDLNPANRAIDLNMKHISLLTR